MYGERHSTFDIFLFKLESLYILTMCLIIIRYLIMPENETVSGQKLYSHRNVFNIPPESQGL